MEVATLTSLRISSVCSRSSPEIRRGHLIATGAADGVPTVACPRRTCVRRHRK
jgi:hypothetical protein